MSKSLARREFIIMMGGVACLPFIPGCSYQQQRPIRIATHMWPGYEPLSLAKSLGWLDSGQVSLIETESFTDSIRLLEEGRVDASGLTLDEVLRIRESGTKLSVVLICDVSAGADVLVVRQNIKTLGALKGLRIGVEDGALGALMLHQVLQVAKLDKEDVNIVSVSVDKQADAWRRNEIDAAISFEPGYSELIKLGGKVLFDSRQIPELIFDVIAVRTEVLTDDYDDALHHLVAMHLKALEYINKNPEDAAYRMASRFKLSPDQVMATFKGLLLPNLSNNIRLLKTEPPAVQKSAMAVADAMHKAGILKKPLDLVDLVHAEYLPGPGA